MWGVLEKKKKKSVAVGRAVVWCRPSRGLVHVGACMESPFGSDAPTHTRFAADAQLSSLDRLQSVPSLTAGIFQSCVKKDSSA